ncbi:hypothetical protein FRB91_009162 [Serendipita sp. 411]|nr:hypothetical protein FRC19_008793 [Serendipita sp. 401]KAG8850288.1 hypothetical protein FRB91_009162 [Serendipita sp. 411]KAG9053442.1 hypothetical protein FS842_008188 [Serendipita sp. 407]
MGDESNVVASPLPATGDTNTPGLTGDSSTPSLPRNARSRKQVDHGASFLVSQEAIADEQRQKEKAALKAITPRTGATPARTPLVPSSAEHIPVFGTAGESGKVLEDAVNQYNKARLNVRMADVQACEVGANKKLEQFITRFRDDPADTSMPDERGITDQLKVWIREGKAGVLEKVGNEAEDGADGLFAWRVVEGDEPGAAAHTHPAPAPAPAPAGSGSHPHEGTAGSSSPSAKREWLVFFQAKVEKPASLHGDLDATMVDFTYKNKNDLQMLLLDKKVKEERAKYKSNVRVFGGYLVYTTKSIVFIPLPEVLKYANTPANIEKCKAEPVVVNRLMTEKLMATHRAKTDFLSSIMNYDHLNLDQLTSQFATHATIGDAGTSTAGPVPART